MLTFIEQVINMASPPSPQGLGKGMMLIAFLLVLFLLSLFFQDLIDKKQNPNQNLQTTTKEGYREVVLTRNAQGHYIALGTLNGKAVTFLLDTGATTVSIPASIAQQLGLKRGSPVQTSTANGIITTYATEINQISLGEIQLSEVRASINPAMHGDDEILLGMSFLKHLEFSQRGNQLTLRQHLNN